MLPLKTTITGDLQEDSLTKDSKENPITAGSKENLKKSSITENPKKFLITEDTKKTLSIITLKRTLKTATLRRTLKKSVSLKIFKSFRTFNNLLVISHNRVDDWNKLLHKRIWYWKASSLDSHWKIGVKDIFSYTFMPQCK